jgi:hypothetical protein
LADRLRCDRALPACGNCLDNLPQTESCDYSLTRDYLELLNSRQKTKRLRRHKPSLPTPAPSTASPPPKIKEEEEEDDDDDDDDGSVTSITPSTTHDDGDDEDSDSTTKTTHDGLRQKLDRLERLINGLVESHKSCCESKKKQKDLEKAGKLQSRASEEDLGDSHSIAADDNQSTNSRVGESAWGSFVSEVSRPSKIHSNNVREEILPD